MKPTQKPGKSPYNPPVKLRAEILPQKFIKPKQQSSSESQSDSEQSSYDSEVQDFANQFYDQTVQQADKSLQQKKDNQLKPQQQKNQNKQNVNDKQTQKIKKTLTEQDKLNARLKEIKDNFNNLDMDLIMFKKKDEKKLKQIAEFLSKKHKQKRDFMKKLKKIKNSEKQKRKIEQEMRKKHEQQQHSKKLQQIRNISILIKQKIEKKKQEEEQRLQDIESFYQNFHKKYNKQKLYKRMQLSDKKRRNKKIEQQNQYLRQRKSVVSQIISAEDINEFKKRREEFLKDTQKVKQAQKLQKHSQLTDKNKELRERIYIGNRYMQMQDQQTRRQKIRQLPKEKRDKIKKYNSYVKQNFLPITSKDEQNENGDHHQQIEEENDIFQKDGKMYRKIKRPRYLNGLQIGEVVQNVPLPKTEREIRMVGNSYLEHVKLLPKKRHTQSVDLSLKQQKPKPMTSRVQIPKIAKKLGKITLSKNPNRHEIQNLINSLKARDEVISRKQHYLKVSKCEGGSNPEKSALDEDLLDNIEKKINLLGKL